MSHIQVYIVLLLKQILQTFKRYQMSASLVWMLNKYKLCLACVCMRLSLIYVALGMDFGLWDSLAQVLRVFDETPSLFWCYVGRRALTAVLPECSGGIKLFREGIVGLSFSFAQFFLSSMGTTSYAVCCLYFYHFWK